MRFNGYICSGKEDRVFNGYSAQLYCPGCRRRRRQPKLSALLDYGPSKISAAFEKA